MCTSAAMDVRTPVDRRGQPLRWRACKSRGGSQEGLLEYLGAAPASCGVR